MYGKHHWLEVINWLYTFEKNRVGIFKYTLYINMLNWTCRGLSDCLCVNIFLHEQFSKFSFVAVNRYSLFSVNAVDENTPA